MFTSLALFFFFFLNLSKSSLYSSGLLQKLAESLLQYVAENILAPVLFEIGGNFVTVFHSARLICGNFQPQLISFSNN